MKFLIVFVLVFTPPVAAQPIDTVKAAPLPYDELDDAQAIEADPFGALYVADAGRHVVVKLDTSGAFIERIGGPGSREGAFDRPLDVDPTNGLVLLVADTGNNRIQLYSRSHAFLGSIPLTAGEAAQVTYRRQDVDQRSMGTGRPISVASFGSNEIVAIDSDRNAVLKWNENRRLTRVIGDVDAGEGMLAEPVSLWTDDESLIYVADRGRRAILVFDHFGSYVRTIGAERLAGIVAVSGYDDEVFAVFPDRIQIYNREGRIERTIVPSIREAIVDVTAADDARLFALTAGRVYRLDD